MRTAVTLIAFLIPTSVVAQFADIHVPPMFFKIVVLEDPDPDVDVPVHLAFLFHAESTRELAPSHRPSRGLGGWTLL